MRYWQKDIETMPRKELEALQLEKFKHIAKYCYDNVPFYKKRFDENKISPDKIKTLSDIEYIPYTTKEDIRDNYPDGLFACPKSKIVRYHASSGTTGKPTVVGYTRNDLNMWSDVMARIVTAAGVTEEDTVQIAFGYGLFTGALGLHYGLEKVGAAVVPASSGNTEKQVMLLQDLKVTGLVATPSYALYIGEVAKELGVKKEDLYLKHGLFGSEGCTVEMRDKIESQLGVFATDNYGMSELVGPGVSGDCIYRAGMHINEDHFLPEIINSQSLQTLERGEVGELVVTTLSKEAFPILRYRTKDITRLDYDVCKCGRTFARMAKVMGRSDDMLKIRGVNVFPSQIESVLATVPQAGPHYQIIVTNENFMDRIEVKVELLDASVLGKYSELEAVHDLIYSKLHTVLGIDAKVTIVSPKSIERFVGKAKRVVDMRNKG